MSLCNADADIGTALLNLGRLAEHDEFSWSLVLLGYSVTFQGRLERADDA